METLHLSIEPQPHHSFFRSPLYLFLIHQRFSKLPVKPREKRSVWIMNGAILALAAALISIFGFVPWLVIQLTMMTVTGGCGVWLFYVQHQFEDAYWVKGEEWDFTTAAMEGSSFYKLPKILQWFSGNIRFHHVHHLNPMIPNYNLEKCHKSDPFFDAAPVLKFFSSFKTINYRLWDEEAEQDDRLPPIEAANRPPGTRSGGLDSAKHKQAEFQRLSTWDFNCPEFHSPFPAANFIWPIFIGLKSLAKIRFVENDPPSSHASADHGHP